MAAAVITAIRKRNEDLSAIAEEADPLLDNLIENLPPEENWEAEYTLGILLVGYGYFFSFV